MVIASGAVTSISLHDAISLGLVQTHPRQLMEEGEGKLNEHLDRFDRKRERVGRELIDNELAALRGMQRVFINEVVAIREIPKQTHLISKSIEQAIVGGRELAHPAAPIALITTRVPLFPQFDKGLAGKLQDDYNAMLGNFLRCVRTGRKNSLQTESGRLKEKLEANTTALLETVMANGVFFLALPTPPPSGFEFEKGKLQGKSGWFNQSQPTTLKPTLEKYQEKLAAVQRIAFQTRLIQIASEIFIL